MYTTQGYIPENITLSVSPSLSRPTPLSCSFFLDLPLRFCLSCSVSPLSPFSFLLQPALYLSLCDGMRWAQWLSNEMK